MGHALNTFIFRFVWGGGRMSLWARGLNPWRLINLLTSGPKSWQASEAEDENWAFGLFHFFESWLKLLAKNYNSITFDITLIHTYNLYIEYTYIYIYIEYIEYIEYVHRMQNLRHSST